MSGYTNVYGEPIDMAALRARMREHYAKGYLSSAGKRKPTVKNG